jgi:hypothetical protein
MTTKTPSNSLNFHVLLEVNSVVRLNEWDCTCHGGNGVLLLSLELSCTFKGNSIAGLKEWNCTCSGGDGILLLFLERGLRASRRKNVEECE